MDCPHFIDEEIPLWDTNAVSHRESTGKQNFMRRILISPLRGSVDVLTGPALLWEGECWRVLGVPCSPGPWWCKVSLKGDHVRTGRRPAVLTCGCCFHGLGFVLSFKWSQSHFWHGSRSREGKGENGLMHLRQEIRCWVSLGLGLLKASWEMEPGFGEGKFGLFLQVRQCPSLCHHTEGKEELDLGGIWTTWNVTKLINQQLCKFSHKPCT